MLIRRVRWAGLVLLGLMVAVGGGEPEEQQEEDAWCVPWCVCTEEASSGIRRADCSDRHLLNVDAELLGGELRVQALDFSRNSLSELPADFPGGVRGRWRVLALSLANNAIASVSPLALRGMHALHALDLSENRISVLPPGFLREVPALRALSLAGNRLRPDQGESGWVLMEAPHLRQLSLARCNLGHLGSRTFEGLPALKALELDGNQLTELPAHLPLTLRRLEVSDNPLNCGDPVLRQRLAGLQQDRPVCPDDLGTPRRSEAMRVEETPAIFAGLLCPDIQDTFDSSTEDFEEFNDIPTNRSSRLSIPQNRDYKWTEIGGVPGLWAAIAGYLAGLMSAAWAVWCYFYCRGCWRRSRCCSCCRRGRSDSRAVSDTSSRALLTESATSLLIDLDQESDRPPGTPPPPYPSIL